MKLNYFRQLLPAVALATSCTVAVAEDIDLYAIDSSVQGKPNVLIIIDNSSNWGSTFSSTNVPQARCPNATVNQLNTKFCNEILALTTVLATLDDKIRVGLMMFNETGTNGAYVRYGIRDMNETNKAALINLINGLYVGGSQTDSSGSNQPYGKTMFEAFKYFGGYTNPANANLDTAGTPVDATHFGDYAYAGIDATGAKRRDYWGNASSVMRSAQSYLGGAAVPAEAALAGPSATEYNSPIGDGCAKNFILFISNGNPSGGGADSSGDPAAISTLLGNVVPTTTQLGSPETHASKADEMALYLYLTDVSPLAGKQNVITYTMGVYLPASSAGKCVWGPNISTDDCNMITLMQSMASNGGGKFYRAQDAASLQTMFDAFFAEVLAINSVFVSSSLPVSINTQGTYLNQVYMGMFRPDQGSRPRWAGNFKEYQFTFNSASGLLTLADKNGVAAISNSGSGFITPSATSFWSTPQTTNGTVSGNFWVNSPAGTPATITDAPDGEVVEKGGAAQKIRGANLTDQASRKVYTLPVACAGSAAACAVGSGAPLSNFGFTTTNIAGSSFETAFGVTGSTAAADLTDLVNWVRGRDNAGNEATPGPGTFGTTAITVRPSIHGDVLHSRPLLVNYDAAGTNIVAFYGSNDGTLRAVQAGQGTNGGTELWAFVAPDHFGKFKRLRAGTPLLQLPSPSSGLPPPADPDTGPPKAPKDYFFDGAVTAYEVRNASGAITQAYVFAVARRGGNFIYAFDVTDPAAPKYLWKRSAQDNIGGAHFGDLAFTFSRPQVGKIRSVSDPKGRAVVILGGGYYGGYDSSGAPIGEDADPATHCSGPGCGNRVFVLDAATGDEIGSFQQGFGGNNIERSVAADITLVDSDGDGLTDRLYAADTGGNVWRMDVNDADPTKWQLYKFASVGNGDHKFLYPPDFVLTGSYTAVLLGTGDREKPFKANQVDRFYMFKDKETGLIVSTASDAPSASWPIAGDQATGGNMADVVASLAADSSGAALTATLDQANNNGWFYTLATGEKVVNGALVAGGVAYFSTNTPPVPGVCRGDLGEARAYGLRFGRGTPGRDLDQNGTFGAGDFYVKLDGGGLPPSPVGGLVKVLDSATGTEVIVPFIIGSGGTSPPPPPPGGASGRTGGMACAAGKVPSSIGGAMVCIPIDQSRKKNYWYHKYDQ